MYVAEQKNRIKKPKIMEVQEGGKTIKYYSKTAVAEYLGRSMANIYTLFSEYTKQTGLEVPQLRDGNSVYVREDELNKVIKAMLPLRAEMLGLNKDEEKQ